MSEHIGNVGERSEFFVVVESVKVQDGKFGATAIHTMSDSANNKLVWFAKGSRENWLKAGSVYTVKATVKRHNVFQGMNQTELQRVKVLKEE